MRLECRNVVVDPNKRKIATDDAGNIEVTKTTWNVRESADSVWIWIDTYTAACQEAAICAMPCACVIASAEVESPSTS